MLNSKAINFLTKSGGPEATSDRRSFPRPDSPHPRKLKHLGLLSFEDKENVRVASNQSIAKKSHVDNTGSIEPPTLIAPGITDIFSPLSSLSSFTFPLSTTSPSPSAMAKASGFGQVSGNSPFSCSLSNISQSSSMARASGFVKATGQPPFSSSLSSISPSSSMAHVSGFGTATGMSPFTFPFSNTSPSPSEAHGSKVGKAKRVTWSKNQETEISTPVPSPFWEPGQHYRPPHLTSLEQVLARIRLHKIPLIPSVQSFLIHDEDEDENFYDQYYDIDMRCERRLYLKKRKNRIREANKLESSGNEANFFKTESEVRLELEGELEYLFVETLENELQYVPNEVGTIEIELQSIECEDLELVETR